MREEYFVFDQPEIKRIFRSYVLRRRQIIEEFGDFAIRKVGRTKRLEYIFQDMVDWWDSDMDAEALKEMIFKKRYYRAVFNNVLEFSRFRSVLDGSGIDWKVSYSRVYYVPLSDLEDEKALRSYISKNVWKNIRRARNRIRTRFGKFSISECAFSHYDWTVENIRRRHPGSSFDDPLFVQTLKKVLEILNEQGKLRVWVLKTGDEVLATDYVIESDKVALSYIAGFTLEFDAYRLLIFNTVKSYLERGFKEFNFMKGESSYKRQWTDKFYKLYRYETLHPSLPIRFLSLLS